MSNYVISHGIHTLPKAIMFKANNCLFLHAFSNGSSKNVLSFLINFKIFSITKKPQFIQPSSNLDFP